MKNKCLDILDDYLYPNSLRIKIFAICNLEKIENQYFIREKSFRKIYYYYHEIGIRNTLLRIISRSREKIRNDKYFSIGIGKIVQSSSILFSQEQVVYFIAYNHSACPERVVIHEKFVFLANIADFPWIKESRIVQLKQINQPKWWKNLLAWSPYSGYSIAEFKMDMIFKKVKQYWQSVSIQSKKYFSLKTQSEITEIKFSKKEIWPPKIKNAVLFGYGNYAKTMLLPNIHRKIRVNTIHEIDATQLIPMQSHIHYDTNPFPREDKKYAVYFIAGYHHMHSDLAIKGLKNGADVVVEKPLMTTKQDLVTLITAMQKTSSELYACFQRRYHRFNDYVYEDFKLKRGDPISYYAIIYEEVLPEFHWYRWPNSRSAIISNGCHWIDHFLFLNYFSPVIRFNVLKTKNNELMILVELRNGATLSLTLSHVGSARIGMQEYIELRSGRNTAKISNGKCYQSENNIRIIRRSTINKFESYRKMYQLISENIINKHLPRLSDSWQKVAMVSQLILELDELSG